MGESYTDSEKKILARYFTNTDSDIFGLINLPDTTKGALFARYSRTHKPLRRLFLDEFYSEAEMSGSSESMGAERAERLYDRVFSEYGDDSVAQLGGAHIACENVSNVVSKILERGRLMSYLEKSTRYMDFSSKVSERFRYVTPQEIAESASRSEYEKAMNVLFECYSETASRMQKFYSKIFPQKNGTSDTDYSRALKAKAYDAARGLLPASCETNIGIFGSGQSYENMLIKMFAHPLAEARHAAEAILRETRKIIPSFMKRVDMEDRGAAWSEYLKRTASAAETESAVWSPGSAGGYPMRSASDVKLLDFDPEGEMKILAAVLFEASDMSFSAALSTARTMNFQQRQDLMRAYTGQRRNRRHKPGRALEETFYMFEIVSDYGAFRDLQRHRMLTSEWQTLGCRHGYIMPEDISEAGCEGLFAAAMTEACTAWEALAETVGEKSAAYAVPFAYKIRYRLKLNAREAMHLIELRTMKSAHPSYKRTAQQMRYLISEHAGHKLIAETMKFAGRDSDRHLERLP